MKKSFLLLLIVIFVGSFLIFKPSFVSACSCAEPQPVEIELQNKTAVFSGKVIKIKDERFNPLFQSSDDPISVLFEVKSIWKGPKRSQLIVTTAKSSASCGAEFIEGGEYLVYANGDSKKLKTGLCERTKPLQNANEELRILGAGKKPYTKVNLESQRGGASYWAIGGGLALLFILIFLIIKRLR